MNHRLLHEIIVLVAGTMAPGVAACGDQAAATASAHASASAAPTATTKASVMATATATAASAASTTMVVPDDSPCAKAVHALHKLKHPKDPEDTVQIAHDIKTCGTDKWSQKGIDCIIAAKDSATADKCDLKK